MSQDQINAEADALRVRYGETLSIDEFAAILGTSANALRVRSHKYRDLPPPLPRTRPQRWPVTRIARWLTNAGLDEEAGAELPQSSRRRPGRPRLGST